MWTRALVLGVALSLGVLTSCTGTDAPDPAPSSSAKVLDGDLQLLRSTDWQTYPLFDLVRTTASATYSSVSDQRTQGSRLLGVVISEEYLQARALVVYTQPHLGPGQLGVAILQADDGEITQIGTGSIGDHQDQDGHNDFTLTSAVFDPTTAGVDVYLGGDSGQYRRLQVKMVANNYTYLPEQTNWLQMSTDPSDPVFADAERVDTQQVPQHDVVRVQLPAQADTGSKMSAPSGT